MRGGPSPFNYFSVSKTEFQNFMFMWATYPSGGVSNDTRMMLDINDIFKNRFDRNTLMLKIPHVFKNLKGLDVNFEMVTSNTL